VGGKKIRRKQSGWHCDNYRHLFILLCCNKVFSCNGAISECYSDSRMFGLSHSTWVTKQNMLCYHHDCLKNQMLLMAWAKKGNYLRYGLGKLLSSFWILFCVAHGSFMELTCYFSEEVLCMMWCIFGCVNHYCIKKGVPTTVLKKIQNFSHWHPMPITV